MDAAGGRPVAGRKTGSVVNDAIRCRNALNKIEDCGRVAEVRKEAATTLKKLGF